MDRSSNLQVWSQTFINKIEVGVFSPPNGPDDYFCDYSHMKGKGWHECSTPSNRGCWLSNGTHEYNIRTNYEADAPIGITRKYTLDVSNKTLALDGCFNPDGKVFNQSYPGLGSRHAGETPSKLPSRIISDIMAAPSTCMGSVNLGRWKLMVLMVLHSEYIPQIPAAFLSVSIISESPQMSNCWIPYERFIHV